MGGSRGPVPCERRHEEVVSARVVGGLRRSGCGVPVRRDRVPPLDGATRHRYGQRLAEQQFARSGSRTAVAARRSGIRRSIGKPAAARFSVHPQGPVGELASTSWERIMNPRDTNASDPAPATSSGGFFMTYLLRGLRGRMRQLVFVAAGLAVGVAAVVTLTAASTGVSQAQAAVLHSLYGVGTDISVTTEAPAGGS